MIKNCESGKSRIGLALVAVALVIVLGTVIIMAMTGGEKEIDDPKNDTSYSQTEIINQIEGGDTSTQDPVKDEEEEQPALIKTVDAKGNVTWIGNKPVDIHLPGKGRVIKGRKMATATNIKMKPHTREQEAAKVVHPSLDRIGKGAKKPPARTDGEDTSQEGEGDSKMGEGKGAGGGK